MEPKQLEKWVCGPKVSGFESSVGRQERGPVSRWEMHFCSSHLLSKCPWTMFGGQQHKCWASPRSIINQKLCSKCMTLVLVDCTLVFLSFFSCCRVSQQSKSGTPLSISVRPVLVLWSMTDLQTLRVWAGTVAVVREAVSRGKWLGKYSVESLWEKKNTFFTAISPLHNSKSQSSNKQVDSEITLFSTMCKRDVQNTPTRAHTHTHTHKHSCQNLPLSYSSGGGGSSVLMADKILQ